MSILSDNDIVNKDIYESIKDFEVECDICLGILLNPKQCTICETTYCKKCIESWLEKNTDCPMRCKNFKIQDPPRVVRNMLAKLIFKCAKCLKQHSYEKYVIHLENGCFVEPDIEKLECPLCKVVSEITSENINAYSKQINADLEAQIDNLQKELNVSHRKNANYALELANKDDNNKKLIETFEAQFRNLKNEIQSYKAIIDVLNEDKKTINYDNSLTKNNNSFSNIVPLKMAWNTHQKKTSFVLTNNNRTIQINFSSCWNYYIADHTFCQNKDENFMVEITTSNPAYSRIGFVNDKFEYDCLCLNKSGAFVILGKGDTFQTEKTELFRNSEMSLIANSPKIYNFTLNGHTGDLTICNEVGDLYGKAKLIGKNFRFLISNCNNGTGTYRFL